MPEVRNRNCTSGFTFSRQSPRQVVLASVGEAKDINAVGFVSKDDDPALAREQPDVFADFWPSGSQYCNRKSLRQVLALLDQLVDNPIGRRGASVDQGNLNCNRLKITFGRRRTAGYWHPSTTPRFRSSSRTARLVSAASNGPTRPAARSASASRTIRRTS